MRLHDLKASIYLLQAVFALALIALGMRMSAGTTITDLIQSLACFASGTALLLFSIATYFLRRDRDIWS